MVVKYKGNWIPTKTVEEMANTQYDVLIIGSGPGGGATHLRAGLCFGMRLLQDRFDLN